MKILNVILTSVNGGAEKVFLDYCQNLKELDHEVFAVVKDDAPYAEKLRQLGIPFIKTSNKYGYFDPTTINNIKKAITEFDIQTTITHAGKATVLTKKAIKKSKKTIYRCSVNHSNNVKRSIGADLIINVNKQIFYKTIDSGQDAAKSIIVHNAIATKEVTKVIDFDKEQIVIGMMSRLDPHKGYKKMLDVIKHLNQSSQKKFTLKIAGEGGYKDTIAQYAKQLHISDQIEFLGWIEDKEAFFKQIDIFTLPSDNETFGLVILEAINHGVPVIATDTDGAKEIIKNDKDGLIVNLEPAADFINSMSKAINKMVENPAQALEMTKSAQQKLQQRFSFNSLKTNLREIFGPKSK